MLTIRRHFPSLLEIPCCTGPIWWPFCSSQALPEPSAGDLASVLLKIRTVQLWQEAFWGWSMCVTAQGLRGQWGLLSPGKVESKQRPLRVSVSPCGETWWPHLGPLSTPQGMPWLLRAFMFWMLIGKFKPDNASLSSIYYLCLGEFWPHRWAHDLWCKILCKATFLFCPPYYFLNVLGPGSIISSFSLSSQGGW